MKSITRTTRRTVPRRTVPRRFGIERFEDRIMLTSSMFTFASYALEPTVSPLSTVHAVDIDDDGETDVLTAGNDGVGWYRSTRDGNFESLREISTIAYDQVISSDLDSDGDIDILSRDNSGNVAWFNNTDGRGDFAFESQIIANPDLGESLVVADLDGDRDQDLIVADVNNNISWYRNDDGLFDQQAAVTSPVSSSPELATADLDGDGRIDLVVASDAGLHWYPISDGNFLGATPKTITEIAAASNPLATDVDLDGDLDVLASFSDSVDGSSDIIWFKNTDGEFSVGSAISGGTAPVVTRLAVADIDADGDTDIVAIRASNADVTSGGRFVWYENTNRRGKFSAETRIQGIDSFSFDLADIDTNGKTDALLADTNGSLTYSSHRLIGDSNDDGKFDSSDLVSVFIAAEYEDDLPGNSRFEEGDWDGSGDFDSRDIILAFGSTAYQFDAVSYPRLLFGEESIPELREKIKGDAFKSIFASELNYAKRQLAQDFTSPDASEITKGNLVVRLALVVLLLEEDDPDRAPIAEKVREILLNLNEGVWPGRFSFPDHHADWDGNDEFQPWFAGGVIMNYALAYDWMVGIGELVGNERLDVRFRILRVAQIEHSIQSTPRDQIDLSKYQVRIANYLFRSIGGVGIAALTFPGQTGTIYDPRQRMEVEDIRPFDTQEVLQWITSELFHQITVAPADDPPNPEGLIENMVSRDGFYREGFTYQNDSFGVMLPFLVAYDKTTGIDYLSNDGPFDDRIAQMFVTDFRVMLPDGERPRLGDAYSGYWYMWHELIADYSPYPDLHHWYAEIRQRPQIRASIDAFRAVRTPLPEPSFRTEFLPDAGFAVFRDKWGTDATYLMLNAQGKATNGHDQADQGSISLYANGAHLVVDPGYGTAYGFDPNEGPGRKKGGKWDWINSGLGHSGVTVDSIYTVDNTPRDSYLTTSVHPRIKQSYADSLDPAQLENTLAAESIDYAESHVHYEVKDVELVRGVAFPRHRYFILEDNITGSEIHEYGWQLQLGRTETGEFTGDGPEYLWVTPNRYGQDVGLGITMLDSNRSVNVYGNGPTNYSGVAFPQDTYDRNYILANETNQNTRYVTLLDPHALSNRKIETETIVEGKVWKVVHSPDSYDLILSQSHSQAITFGEISTDARFLVASIDVVEGEEVLISIFTKGGSSLEVGYDRPRSFEIPADGIFHDQFIVAQTAAMARPVERIPGDANADGIFNSSDIVAVLAANEYEDDIPGNSTFEEGDWNGDGEFDASDFVAAFTSSPYVREAVVLDSDLIDSMFGETNSHSLRPTHAVEDSSEFTQMTNKLATDQ